MGTATSSDVSGIYPLALESPTDGSAEHLTLMPVLQGNGVARQVERGGSGSRLLFCNRSGGTIASTRCLLHRRADSIELLCFHDRGMGASAASRQPYGMADQAADVRALLAAMVLQRTVIADRVAEAPFRADEGDHGLFLQDPQACPDLVHVLSAPSPDGGGA